MDYIRDYFNKTEEIIFSENPQTNLLADDYIDMESFADWWFVYELVTNTAPNAPKSSYMHNDRNGKLIAGPVWEFDWGTFRSADQFMITNSIW